MCTLYCAVSACSSSAPPGKADKPAAPPYSVERPVAGLTPPAPRPESFKRGVSLDLFVGEVAEANRVAYGDWLSQVAQLGATDLELVVQWSQLDASSVELAPHASNTVDDDFLAWLMDQAHARKLRVMLTPVIELEQPSAEHRPVAPSDPARWFWSYHRFALHYARIAEAHKATCFAVGADLPPELARDAHWQGIISDVRKAFKGQVTYVARPEKLESLSMWSALDIISVAGTGELISRSSKGPSPAFSALSQRLQAFTKASGKPYQLTGVQPASKAQSPLDQLDGARALYQSLQAEHTLGGLFVALARPGFAQLTASVGSPYAEVLRHWYGRLSAPSKSN